MRLVYTVPFTPAEIESYRQLVFSNLIMGLREIVDAMDVWDIPVRTENLDAVALIDSASELDEGQSFPREYMVALRALWEDEGVIAAYGRANEAALPDKLVSDSSTNTKAQD